jgi:uncharacterized protein (DUF2132 family)
MEHPMIEEQQNNPLHGLGLEIMLTELVKFYDWKILYAALRLECFNLNPSHEGSLKFLKKTEWARERVESFYLYRFKRMPKGSSAQFELKPRERGFANGIVPRKPEPLTIELIEQMRTKATADYEAMKANNSKGYSKKVHEGAYKTRTNENRAKPSQDPNNPWGK